YLSRSPDSLYVLLAVGCVLLVPLRAGIADICALRRGRARSFWWGLAAAVATAALVPFAFRLGVDLLTPYFARDLTIYARHTVFSFMPVGLGIWAFISIPI